MPAPFVDTLSDHDFFKGLERSHLEFLAQCAQERELAQNELLFRHGDAAKNFYLLRSGQIVLEVPAISGPTLEVQHIGAEQILGWSWLIPPYRWGFNARALEPVTLWEFDGAAVIRRCEEDSAFGYAILKRFSALMSERLEVARQRMIDHWNPPGFA